MKAVSMFESFLHILLQLSGYTTESPLLCPLYPMSGHILKAMAIGYGHVVSRMTLHQTCGISPKDDLC